MTTNKEPSDWNKAPKPYFFDIEVEGEEVHREEPAPAAAKEPYQSTLDECSGSQRHEGRNARLERQFRKREEKRENLGIVVLILAILIPFGVVLGAMTYGNPSWTESHPSGGSGSRCGYTPATPCGWGYTATGSKPVCQYTVPDGGPNGYHYEYRYCE